MIHRDSPPQFFLGWVDPRYERREARRLGGIENLDQRDCMRYEDADTEERARFLAERKRKVGLAPFIYQRLNIIGRPLDGLIDWTWDEELFTDEYAWDDSKAVSS